MSPSSDANEREEKCKDRADENYSKDGLHHRRRCSPADSGSAPARG
jgi:hypothetical protein